MHHNLQREQYNKSHMPFVQLLQLFIFRGCVSSSFSCYNCFLVYFTGELFFSLFFFYKFIYLFNFWLRWVFVAACGLSQVAASGDYSSLWCVGFSLWWLLLLWSTGSRRAGFSSCITQAQQLWLAGSRAQAQQLWRTGLVAPRHVGSSQTRARTCVPGIGRRILNHCATREVPTGELFKLECPCRTPGDVMMQVPFRRAGGRPGTLHFSRDPRRHPHCWARPHLEQQDFKTTPGHHIHCRHQAFPFSKYKGKYSGIFYLIYIH